MASRTLGQGKGASSAAYLPPNFTASNWTATTVTSGYTQPSAGSNVTIAFSQTGWMVPGMQVYISNGGLYQVVSIASSTSATLTNLAGYSNPTGSITSGGSVRPGARLPHHGHGPASVSSRSSGLNGTGADFSAGDTEDSPGGRWSERPVPRCGRCRCIPMLSALTSASTTSCRRICTPPPTWHARTRRVLSCPMASRTRGPRYGAARDHPQHRTLGAASGGGTTTSAVVRSSASP